MIVQCRDESGCWVRWRVGRRRLAWLPGHSVLALLQFAAEPFTLVIALPALVWWLATWACALVATLVVWPVRALLGRWTVVARLLDSEEREVRRRVRGRAAADSLVARWAAEIERHGRLLPES